MLLSRFHPCTATVLLQLLVLRQFVQPFSIGITSSTSFDLCDKFFSRHDVSASSSTTSRLFCSPSPPSSTTTNHAAEGRQQQRSTAKVAHGVTRNDGPLNQAVAEIAHVSLTKANDLISIGAVWARLEPLQQDELLDQYYDESSSSSRALYADLDSSSDEEKDLDEYIESMQQRRFKRILTPTWIDAGTDLRIYPNPRTFPSCYTMTRETNLLYEDTTFLVVDKPPMLPTQPDASNYFECCPGCTQDLLGPFFDIRGDEIARPLLCHRVDACVGGCVVLSKDENGQRVFHEYQRERQLRKLYLAVTEQPVPLGTHIHWMWAPQTQRRSANGGPPCQLLAQSPPASRRKARQYWNRCVLQVTQCITIQVNGKPYFQSTIRLVTGRKHQVRAQLASGLGCPILGDSLYEPLAGLTLDTLENDEDDALDRAVAQCRVPTEPIGLQAHAILFGGIRVQANPPWWQETEEQHRTHP